MTLRKAANAKGHFLQVQEDADLDCILIWIFLLRLSCEFEVLGSRVCRNEASVMENTCSLGKKFTATAPFHVVGSYFY